MTTFGLKGKLALVTGAARGIGAATVHKFAEHGASVILVDLRKEEVTETADKLKTDFPNLTIETEICDVSKKCQVDALAERLDKKFPHTIDILVNNAAILLVKGYLDVTESEFENVLNVNLKSVHWVTQAFAKRAVAQKRPMSVVNLSSITTNAGMLELSPYVAAKDGINGLTKVLAKELGKYNIRVNAIKPGFVDTPMNTHLDEKYRAEVAKKTPLGRWAKPEEIANTKVTGMTAFGLEGKLALVTGAAQGIGAATTRKFAEHGANVILVDVKEDILRNTAQEIQKDFPNIKIVAEVCDVSQKKEVDALAERVEKIFSKSIDALVNNAAIVNISPYLELKEEDFDKVLETNLKSVHVVTQAFAKQAVAQKRPLAVVNLSSITTNAGMAQIAPYVVAKDGINGLTKVLAKELGKHNIRVNSIKPGFVDTPMNAHLNDASRSDISRQTPLGRMAPPEEIANVIVFFASDLASFCTGSFVDVNGGMTL